MEPMRPGQPSPSSQEPDRPGRDLAIRRIQRRVRVEKQLADVHRRAASAHLDRAYELERMLDDLAAAA